MLILLFLLLYLVTYVAITKKKTYCITIILFVSICYITNEFFSLFHVLDYRHLCLLYSSLSVVLIGILGWNIRKNKEVKITTKIHNCFRMLKEHKILILFIMFFGAIFGLAIYTVPYNWDSMTYHLTRIAQWTQNKSVAHYATGDVRQVTSPTLAEFINLQVYIMSGKKDTWFNLLQCASYATNAGLLYFITKRLGGTKKYCYFSMLLFISMPIAFGEALTTQVDHFSAMWLLMFIYFLLDILDLNYHLTINKDSILKVIILSSCIGFGYLAKPSILFAIIFLHCGYWEYVYTEKTNLRNCCF